MTMSAHDALIWFLTTTVLLVTLLVVGIYFASHSYQRGRGVIHFHAPWKHG